MLLSLDLDLSLETDCGVLVQVVSLGCSGLGLDKTTVAKTKTKITEEATFVTV